VELDALRPDLLRALVDQYIRRHVDPQRLHLLEAVEAEERDLLGKLAGGAS
jgi:hypothetical protein